MAMFWQKSPSSRWIRDNNITISGNGASTPSTTFSQGCTQIRVCSTLPIWFQIDGSGSATANASMYLPANWESFFTVTAGQLCAALSTSTSTGYCSVSEMA
jgi:hypothetical protein